MQSFVQNLDVCEFEFICICELLVRMKRAELIVNGASAYLKEDVKSFALLFNK